MKAWKSVKHLVSHKVSDQFQTPHSHVSRESLSHNPHVRSTYTQFYDTLIHFYTPCFPSFCLLFILTFKLIAFIIPQWYPYFNCLVLKFGIPLSKCFFFFLFFFLFLTQNTNQYFSSKAPARGSHLLCPPPFLLWLSENDRTRKD